MSNGWYRVPRCLSRSDLWEALDPVGRCLVCVLFEDAAYQPQKIEWRKQERTLLPGEVLTTEERLAERVGLMRSQRKQIRNRLRTLENLDFIRRETAPKSERKSTHKGALIGAKNGSIISIVNWADFFPVIESGELKKERKRERKKEPQRANKGPKRGPIQEGNNSEELNNQKKGEAPPGASQVSDEVRDVARVYAQIVKTLSGSASDSLQGKAERAFSKAVSNGVCTIDDIGSAIFYLENPGREDDPVDKDLSHYRQQAVKSPEKFLVNLGAMLVASRNPPIQLPAFQGAEKLLPHQCPSTMNPEWIEEAERNVIRI